MLCPLLILKVHVLSRRYMILTLMSNGFMLVLLFVRAAWLGAMVTLALGAISFMYCRCTQKAEGYLNKVLIGIVTGVIVLPILFPAYTTTLSSRFTSIAKPGKESASAYRIMELDFMYKKSLPKMGDTSSYQTFFFGHGDFTWSYWGPELCGDAYNQDAKTSDAVLIHPGYCMVLTYFFDNGFLGILFIGIFFIGMGVRYITLLQSKISERRKALLMATFLPQIVILICFQFSYDPITPFMWILTALHIALSVRYKASLNKKLMKKQEN